MDTILSTSMIHTVDLVSMSLHYYTTTSNCTRILIATSGCFPIFFDLNGFGTGTLGLHLSIIMVLFVYFNELCVFWNSRSPRWTAAMSNPGSGAKEIRRSPVNFDLRTNQESRDRALDASRSEKRKMFVELGDVIPIIFDPTLQQPVVKSFCYFVLDKMLSFSG